MLIKLRVRQNNVFFCIKKRGQKKYNLRKIFKEGYTEVFLSEYFMKH